MIKNNPYPLQLVKAFRAGEISRQQFIKQFSDWQKSNGINFNCKGSADRNGTFLTYRGITGQLTNGVIVCGKIKAESVFNFQRKIDFALNAEAQTLYNACYFTDKSYNASRGNNYEDREKYKQAADFYIKQAEKLGALWI